MSRGEIWLADLGYQGKIRPILILSVPSGPKERALVSYVIRTTSTHWRQDKGNRTAPLGVHPARPYRSGLLASEAQRAAT